MQRNDLTPGQKLGYERSPTEKSSLNSTYLNKWGDYQKFANFRTQWMTEWYLQGRQLLDALETAQALSSWITRQTPHDGKGLDFHGFLFDQVSVRCRKEVGQ